MKIIIGGASSVGKCVIETANNQEYMGDDKTDADAIYFFLTCAINVTCFDALMKRLYEEGKTKK